ncbi:hypothetical protein BS78_04G096600 [Paspalum vaginatum]|nr:hypothetical protein BS78_04G096600 [Paspalum vaginatum]
MLPSFTPAAMVQTPGRTTQGKARIAPRSSPAAGWSDAASLQPGRASPAGGQGWQQMETRMLGGDADGRKQESSSTHGHQELEERMQGGSNQGIGERCCARKSSLCPTKSTIESQGVPDAAVRLGSGSEQNRSKHEKQDTRLNDAMDGATTASQLRTPDSGQAQVGGTDWRAEVSPPATINAADFGTPSDDRTYTHEDTIDPSLVPRIGMSFKNEDVAREFFRVYAEAVGFEVSMGNGKTHTRVIHSI